MVSAVASPISREVLLSWLGEVMDPEVPVVSIVDLGILRDVKWVDTAQTAVVVTVTPTYSGCPATEVIAQSIKDALQARGVAQVEVRTQLSPPMPSEASQPTARHAECLSQQSTPRALPGPSPRLAS